MHDIVLHSTDLVTVTIMHCTNELLDDKSGNVVLYQSHTMTRDRFRDYVSDSVTISSSSLIETPEKFFGDT